MFRSFAIGRSLGERTLTRLELESAVILASYNGQAEEGLADAPDPFWWHVREALRARQDPRLTVAA